MTSNINVSTSNPNHHEWTKSELTNFFTLFKKYPCQFDIISKNLPGITPAQVKSLYMEHKKLLSLDKVTLDIFLASYEDKSSLKYQNVNNGGDESLKSSNVNKHSSVDGSNNENNLNIQNSPKTPIMNRSNGRWNEERSPVDDDSILEVASELLHLKNTPASILSSKKSSSSSSPLKSSYDTSTSPNKKGSSSSSQSSRPNNALLLKKMLEKCLNNPKLRKWCIYEWFYSDIDQSWYNTNEFQGCLNAIMHHKEKKEATRKEWSCIRSIIGKPRRMSKAFLDSERQKLVNHRINIRLSREGKPTIGGGIDSEKYAKLSKSTIIEPGEKCLFISKDFEVLIGKVLSRSPEYHYKIEYTDSNGNINVVNVLDENVMSYDKDDERNISKKRNFEIATPNRVVITPYKRTKRSLNDSPSSRLSRNINNSIPIINEEDISFLNNLEKLLEEKKVLLNQLKSMNDEAESIGNSPEGDKQINERFRHQYASTILKLDEKNEEIDECLNKIRVKMNHIQIELFPQEQDGVYFYNWYMEMMRQCNTIANNIVSSVRLNNNNNDEKNIEKIEKEKENVYQMVTNAISLCVHFIQCKELKLSEDEVSVALDAAVSVLRPLYEDNFELYKKILNQMKLLKEELLSNNK